DHLDRLVLRDQLHQPGDVPLTALDGLQRRRENAAGIATRDPDPHAPHIDPQPDAVSHGFAPLSGSGRTCGAGFPRRALTPPSLRTLLSPPGTAPLAGLMASLRSAAQGAPAVPASLAARSLLRRSARSSVHPAPRPSQASWLRSAQRLGTPRPPDPPVVYPVVRGSRGPYCVFHRVEGVADRGRVRAAALGEVVL